MYPAPGVYGLNLTSAVPGPSDCTHSGATGLPACCRHATCSCGTARLHAPGLTDATTARTAASCTTVGDCRVTAHPCSGAAVADPAPILACLTEANRDPDAERARLRAACGLLDRLAHRVTRAARTAAPDPRRPSQAVARHGDQQRHGEAAAGGARAACAARLGQHALDAHALVQGVLALGFQLGHRILAAVELGGDLAQARIELAALAAHALQRLGQRLGLGAGTGHGQTGRASCRERV